MWKILLAASIALAPLSSAVACDHGKKAHLAPAPATCCAPAYCVPVRVVPLCCVKVRPQPKPRYAVVKTTVTTTVYAPPRRRCELLHRILPPYPRHQHGLLILVPAQAEAQQQAAK